MSAALARAANDRPGLGIAIRILGMAMGAVLSALVKVCATRGIPVFEIVMFRNIFAFVPLGLMIWRTSGFSVAVRTTKPMAHVVRSGIGLCSMLLLFSAVSRLPLAQFTALQFSSPLFMTALSALILRETVGVHRWSAVAVGFVGVLIMVRPQPGGDTLGVVLAILSAFCAASAAVTIRQLASERGETMVFYFTLAGAVVGAIGSMFHWVTPDLATLGLLAGVGLAGGVAQICFTQALRLAPVAVVAPFDYTQLIWTTLLGFLIWGELPTTVTMAGAAIVAASGLYILRREIRARRKPAAP